MLKNLKNNKGFTLIELMMVIAVIGILVAVLIPKMGGIKNTAKQSGVDSNARQVEAQVNALIEKYKYKGDTLDDALVTALNGNTGTDDDIKNPFVPAEMSAGTANTNAVMIENNTASSTHTGSGFEGIIHVNIQYAGTPSTISGVVITPYDNSGVAQPSVTVAP